MILVYLGWTVVFVALLGSFLSARLCRYDRPLSPSSERTVYAPGEYPSHLAGLVASAVLVSAIERLGQLHAAKAKALKARGISSHQFAQFRHWEKGAAKLSDHRTLASYTLHRNIIASIDRRWDGAITTAQGEVDRAITDLAVATTDLLSTMSPARASELTGLSARRLSTIARAAENTHPAS